MCGLSKVIRVAIKNIKVGDLMVIPDPYVTATVINIVKKNKKVTVTIGDENDANHRSTYTYNEDECFDVVVKESLN